MAPRTICVQSCACRPRAVPFPRGPENEQGRLSDFEYPVCRIAYGRRTARADSPVLRVHGYPRVAGSAGPERRNRPSHEPKGVPWHYKSPSADHATAPRRTRLMPISSANCWPNAARLLSAAAESASWRPWLLAPAQEAAWLLVFVPTTAARVRPPISLSP